MSVRIRRRDLLVAGGLLLPSRAFAQAMFQSTDKPDLTPRLLSDRFDGTMALDGHQNGGKAGVNLNFLTGVLDPRIVFSRPSPASYIGSDGLVHTALSGVPRFNYDPVSLAIRGFLPEPQSTNLITQSGNIGGTNWAATNASVTTHALVSPDGSTSATKIADAAINVAFFCYTNPPAAVSSGGTTTVSAYFKKDTGRYMQIGCFSAATTTAYWATVDLQTGAITESSATGAATNKGSTIELDGNGFYRVAVAGTLTGATNYYLLIAMVNSPTPGAFAPSYTGSGVFNYVWGAQSEAAGAASSYIPTISTPATRAADVAYIPGPSLPAALGGQYITAIIETFGPPANTPTVVLAEVYSGVSYWCADFQATNAALFDYGGQGHGPAPLAGASSPGALTRIGVMINGTNLQAVGANGLAPATSAYRSPYAFSPVTYLRIGGQHAGIGQPGVPIRRIKIWPRAFSLAQFQAMTLGAQ